MCYMSSITLFELLSGVKTEQHLHDITTLRKWIIPLFFDDDISETAAKIFRELRTINQLIDYRDIFIAATANVHACYVATLNREHFERISGIRLLKYNA